MAVTTTCIGAYPKPAWSPISDWFSADSASTSGGDLTRRHNIELEAMGDEHEALLHRAVVEAVTDQVRSGVDVITDGEQRRENYIHYHCRHIDGFDFETLTSRSLRNGAYVSDVPTVVAPVAPTDPFLPRDFAEAQQASARPVKMTIPGPLTIMGTTADAHYLDDSRLALDLADALNHEARALADAGCTHIQIDEPLFARETDRALDFGMDALERTLRGLGTVTTTVHICCGYPSALDDADYPKADQSAYTKLIPHLDGMDCVHQISIEDAHRHNDLGLLELFERSTVVFGAIAIASSRLESVDAVVARLGEALEHIDARRLVVAPDCGLGFLPRELAISKLEVMTTAASEVG